MVQYVIVTMIIIMVYGYCTTILLYHYIIVSMIVIVYYSNCDSNGCMLIPVGIHILESQLL